ncbi:Dockerin type I repeat [uncultured Ruminococcus sp.]|nr:Dockerin type I repeat [uncultured Ruminococcus sp.]
MNPECEIYDSYLTMYQFTGTIYGYENSTAHEYAEKYEYNFSAIDAEPEETTAVTTSEDVATTVSQTEMTTPEETQVSQIETSVSQITTSEPAITTVSQVSTSAETTVSVVTTPEITKRTDEHGNIVITVGDVNDDGRVSALDAAIIARKLAEGRSSDLNKWAADYNGDGKVTALDCSEIARFLAKLSIIEHTTAPNENKTETTKTTVKLKEPNKKNYDLNKFSGIKKYVNDCIKYKAAAEYGITKIIYDDTVDPWDSYSWDAPADYIPNIEYYKEHNDPILPAGILWTADELVDSAYTNLYMMVEELKGTGEWEDETAYLTQLIVTWKELGGGNYQLYIMWH